MDSVRINNLYRFIKGRIDEADAKEKEVKRCTSCGTVTKGDKGCSACVAKDIGVKEMAPVGDKDLVTKQKVTAQTEKPATASAQDKNLRSANSALEGKARKSEEVPVDMPEPNADAPMSDVPAGEAPIDMPSGISDDVPGDAPAAAPEGDMKDPSEEPIEEPITFEVTKELAQEVGGKLGVDFEAIPVEQLTMGLKQEQEHADVTGGDPETTAKIALAHLKENPEYYTLLKDMEDKMNAAKDKGDKKSDKKEDKKDKKSDKKAEKEEKKAEKEAEKEEKKAEKEEKKADKKDKEDNPFESKVEEKHKPDCDCGFCQKIKGNKDKKDEPEVKENFEDEHGIAGAKHHKVCKCGHTEDRDDPDDIKCTQCDGGTMVTAEGKLPSIGVDDEKTMMAKLVEMGKTEPAVAWALKALEGKLPSIGVDDEKAMMAKLVEAKEDRFFSVVEGREYDIAIVTIPECTEQGVVIWEDGKEVWSNLESGDNQISESYKDKVLANKKPVSERTSAVVAKGITDKGVAEAIAKDAKGTIKEDADKTFTVTTEKTVPVIQGKGKKLKTKIEMLKSNKGGTK